MAVRRARSSGRSSSVPKLRSRGRKSGSIWHGVLRSRVWWRGAVLDPEAREEVEEHSEQRSLAGRTSARQLLTPKGPRQRHVAAGTASSNYQGQRHNHRPAYFIGDLLQYPPNPAPPKPYHQTHLHPSSLHLYACARDKPVSKLSPHAKGFCCQESSRGQYITPSNLLSSLFFFLSRLYFIGSYPLPSPLPFRTANLRPDGGFSHIVPDISR